VEWGSRDNLPARAIGSISNWLRQRRRELHATRSSSADSHLPSKLSD
jgi:hypothetical protein